jgi:radical SAM protein with 4Fe4S-binding SPASM domain
VQLLVKTLERVPRTCVWEITTRCNLRCVHCECSAGTPRPDELSSEEALALCGQLAELGTKKVSLSGGEPLMRKDWPLIAERLKALDIETHLITNGLLLTPAVARRCVELGLDWVSISIDGLMSTHDSIRRYPRSSPATGARTTGARTTGARTTGARTTGARTTGTSPFRRAFEALALARSKGLRTSVVTHINGRNLGELGELHALLALLPIDGWQLQLGSPQGRMLQAEPGYLVTPEQLPEIARFVAAHQDQPFRVVVTDDVGYYTEQEGLLRDFDQHCYPFWVGCYAGILAMAIESDGGVKGCPSLPSTFTEGNVRARSLRQIWEDPAAFAYNRQWDSHKLRGFCRRCDYRRLCRAGCTSFALASTGSIYENRHCLHRVQTLEAAAARGGR